MTLPVGSVATGAAEETAPKQTQSLSEEILALMKGEELPAAAPPEEAPPEEVPQPEEPEVPEPEETPPEPEQLEVAAEGQWPQSARKRVAEETDKRKRANARADRAEAERDQERETTRQLREQLQDASLPRPTRQDPIADVFDMPGLQKSRGYYKNIRNAFTKALDEQPGSSVEVMTGYKDGQPVSEQFTRESASEIKQNAEYVLSEIIPEREKVLVARAQCDEIAARVYPQFTENDGDNEWAQFVRDSLARVPALAKVPDIAMWIGHALVGRAITVERLKKEMAKNGDVAPGVAERAAPTMSPNARRILSAPKMKASPPVSAARVPSQSVPRRGVDVEAARKVMKANPGSDEAMAAYIDAKLFKGASRGYEKV